MSSNSNEPTAQDFAAIRDMLDAQPVPKHNRQLPEVSDHILAQVSQAQVDYEQGLQELGVVNNPLTPAKFRLAEMRLTFKQLDPKMQAQIAQCRERIQFLLAKHGEAAKLALIYESINLAADEGQ